MITVILQASNIGASFENRNNSLIGNQKELSFLINRLKEDNELNVVMCTSNEAADDDLEALATSNGICIFRGDYSDVLGRICNAINAIGCDNFVRVFANYPLVDILELKKLYEHHISGGYEYSYNEHKDGVLWGTGCEVFSSRLFMKLEQEDLDKAQRETISYYVRQSTDCRILRYSYFNNRPGYKVSLDTLKDLEVINEIVSNVSTIDNETIKKYFDAHQILARYNLEAPSKEVGVEKLFLHPNKIDNLLVENYDMSYPISVEMTLTNACNLNCVYCSDNELRTKQGRTSELTIETIKRLFEDLSKAGTSGVVLEGGGEPTLYSDFEKVVECAKEKGLALGLITNGTVRLEDGVLRNFEWIRVSLDASTASEYKELKGVDCFERVMSNIAHYSKFCDTVGVGYVVTNKNISQLESLVMRLRDLGVSYIQLRPVVDCDELYPRGVDLGYLKFYMNTKFGVIVDGMKENSSSGNGGLPCKTSSITSIISGDGSVYICGRLNIYDWLKPIGNINEQSFNDIWIGDERMKQLKMINDAEFCKNNCPQCRVSKFNQLINRLDNIKSKNFI